MLSNIIKNNMKDILPCSKISFDMKDMTTKFKYFKQRMRMVVFIEPYDKIGFNEQEEIYIDKYNSFQCIKRWYYNQNRDITKEKLKLLFDDYDIFLKMIELSLKSTDGFNYISIAYSVISLNRNIITGLNNLKKTYENCSMLTVLLNDILYNLLLMSEKISNTYIIQMNNTL